MTIQLFALPVIAALIGWFTNFIAIKMLFHPQKKIKFLFWNIQGVFPKRQRLVAEKIGKLVAAELLSLHDIKERINQPETLDMINQKIELKIENYLTTTFPANYPVMAFFVSKKTKEKLKHDFLEEVDELAPQIVAQYIANMEDALQIEKIIEDKIALLSPSKLENLILQILQKEFRFIELSGAVLGFVIGLIQVGIVLL
ncbi:MAG: DUF445 family protein [Chitinophagales bacterium]|nr:DUF445 family protein [Chitinophagales bacterium]